MTTRLQYNKPRLRYLFCLTSAVISFVMRPVAIMATFQFKLKFFLPEQTDIQNLFIVSLETGRSIQRHYPQEQAALVIVEHKMS